MAGKRITLSIVVLTCALGLTGCEKESPNTLRFANSQEIKTFDPALAYDPVSLSVVPTIHETLYQYAYLAEGYQATPLLAADMPKVSEDGLVMTIRIRDDVHFHDDSCFEGGKGRALRALDFVHGIKRVAIPRLDSRGWWYVTGRLQGVEKFRDLLRDATRDEAIKALDQPVEGITAPDDRTLVLKLQRPDPRFVHLLTMNFFSPIARECLEKYADEVGHWRDHPVGTGPFRLKEWAPGRQITLERNRRYHPDFFPTQAAQPFRTQDFLADVSGKTIPFLDAIVMPLIQDRKAGWEQFVNGPLHLSNIPAELANDLFVDKNRLTPTLAEKGIRLDVAPSPGFFYIGFNMKDPLLGRKKQLRQAISSAIQRERWIGALGRGSGQKASSFLPPGIADRPEKAVLKYDYNLARAKQLLKAAGYPGGKGLPAIHLEMPGADQINKKLGEVLIRQLDAVGIRLGVTYNEFAAFMEKMRTGRMQAYLGGWRMDTPDAENAYQLLYGPNAAPGPNDSSFDHAEFNGLYEKIVRLPSGKDRAALIRRMDTIAQEECPWAMGYYPLTRVLMKSSVKGYRGGDLFSNRPKYLRLEPAR